MLSETKTGRNADNQASSLFCTARRLEREPRAGRYVVRSGNCLPKIARHCLVLPRDFAFPITPIFSFIEYPLPLQSYSASSLIYEKALSLRPVEPPIVLLVEDRDFPGLLRKKAPVIVIVKILCYKHQSIGLVLPEIL